MKSQTLVSAVSVVAFLWCANRSIRADTLVTPPGVGEAFGDKGISFDGGEFIYGSSLFASLPGNSEPLITGISFRADESSSLDVVLPSMIIRIGVYQGKLTDVSNYIRPTFTAYSARDLHLTSPVSLDFGIRFSFQNPFLYNPNGGNLVVDFGSSIAGIAKGGLDVQTTFEGRSLFGPNTIGFFLPATEFTYVSVPEPRSIIFWAVFAIFCAIKRRAV